MQDYKRKASSLKEEHDLFLGTHNSVADENDKVKEQVLGLERDNALLMKWILEL